MRCLFKQAEGNEEGQTAVMDEALAYLINDTSRLIRRAFDERARAIGGTHAQCRVLAMLRCYPGIRQAPLAALFDVEPITMSRMIDRLQEGGFVERRDDPQDRRAWLLYLTPQADPIIDRIRLVADDLHVAMLVDISEGEIATLRRTLDKIRKNLVVVKLDHEKASATGKPDRHPNYLLAD
jgi:DNA-binding MarR family transcriptional regulator